MNRGEGMYPYYLKNMISGEGRLLMRGYISDCDHVEWVTPMGDYTLEMTKEENQLWWKPNSFHYIITICIKDRIGHVVKELKMTEIDMTEMVRQIIDDIMISHYFASFVECCMVGAPNSISFGNRIRIEISYNAIFDDYDQVEYKDSIFYDQKNDMLRCLRMVIGEYQEISNNIIPAISIPISEGDLFDLIEKMVLLLSDIRDLPSDVDSLLDMIP